MLIGFTLAAPFFSGRRGVKIGAVVKPDVRRQPSSVSTAGGVLNAAEASRAPIDLSMNTYSRDGQYIGIIPMQARVSPISASKFGKQSAIHHGVMECQSIREGWPAAKYP